jgi:hypothetical protein
MRSECLLELHGITNPSFAKQEKTAGESYKKRSVNNMMAMYGNIMIYERVI